MLKIFLYFTLAITSTWLCYKTIYLLRRKRQCRRALHDTFMNQEIPFPTLKTGHTYAYPSFEVIFNDEEQLAIAKTKGALNDFENKIQMVYTDIDDFDAKSAIFYTWKGRVYS